MSDHSRDCKHGQLARSCEICELERERDGLRAENERLKNENIVRITALNNLHHNLRELQRRNALLENVAGAAKAMWDAPINSPTSGWVKLEAALAALEGPR